MEKIIALDYLKDNPEKLIVFQNYGDLRKKITFFENKVKLPQFKYLFGEEEGKRLYPFFARECERDFDQFLTYLIPNQCNDLLVNIYKNNILYI